MRKMLLVLVLAVVCSEATGPTAKDTAVTPPAGPGIVVASRLDIGVQATLSLSQGAATEWRTSDPRVATVNGLGQLRTFGDGPFVVTATLPGGATVSANVEADPPANLREVLKTIELPTRGTVGDSMRAQARLADSAGAAIALTNRFVSWGTTGPQRATVDDSGVVRLRGSGTACIVAIINTLARCTEVEAMGEPYAGGPQPYVTLAAPDTLAVGDTVRLRPEYRDATGAVQPEPFVFGSHNPRVASVSLTGLVTAVEPGQATVTSMSKGVVRMVVVYVK